MSESHAQPAAGTLNVAELFEGKNICLIGSTGFVGKVALSMLLCKYPGVGKVFALVRPGMGATAADRFFGKVTTSPAFDPLREMWLDGFDDFLHEKVIPIAGDIGRPLCAFDDDQFAEFEQHGGLDVIINSAGLVSFAPSLESAIRINAMGAKNCLEAARRAGAKLVHISTCYVAGQRNGEVWENEPVVGYFPRKDELFDDDFDADAEIADCQKIIEEVRARAKDRQHISKFRERAAASLQAQRRDPDDTMALKLSVARERKLWVHERLTELGIERAEHWGWTNTYTYTKSLGEQVILADDEVEATVVRPAIVESALKFPFAGWNEGFNTTAPLIYLVRKGQRQIVAGDETPLDLIPVDYVCSAILSAAAAILAGVHKPVYQACSSDLNQVTSARLTELTGLAVRKYWRELADAGIDVTANRIKSRLEAFPVSRERFDKYSSPMFARLAERATKVIDDRLPKWGAPRLTAWAERAKDELKKVTEFTGQVTALMDLFQPFIHDFYILFRADNTRELHQMLSPADQMALPWSPETIDWRAYFSGTHFEGLQKWVFPVLDDEFGRKPRSVYTYKDLLELFDAATKLNRHRVAMRLLPKDKDGDTVVYTYERVQDMAEQGAAALRERGVEPGDRVLLMSENRPEWGITYFAILKAGATAVPLDSQLSPGEVVNLVRAGTPKVAVFSHRVLERLCEDLEHDGAEGAEALHLVDRHIQAGLGDGSSGPDVISFDLLLVEPALSPAAVKPPRKGDRVASLIFTSGTTGQPKGVMLTHKNLTTMASKLSAMFNLYRHDGLLSVLPLHHTFEFSAGLLMPLTHGSAINYLEEVEADSLGRALSDEGITGMVGVPALWQLLHRKIFKRISEAGPLVARGFDSLIDGNRAVRDRAPFGWHLGKLVFYPIHRALGGRMRLLISGGSALSPELMKSFRGLGFNMYEGYGMTEASPVLTVQRPGEVPVSGSVGRALPGIDVAIDDADERGVGEVIAKGPNVMAGYYENPEETERAIKDGWLRTGDLGRLDDEGNLYIVGRKKEMILGSSGENIYPDELEELYADSDYVKEVSVVGLSRDGGETVAALVVPDYDHGDMGRGELRERVREHIKSVSQTLPLFKRVKVFHLFDDDLPKTSTRKVKRREVVGELERLERLARSAREAASDQSKGPKGKSSTADLVTDIVAQVSQKAPGSVHASSRFDELGFDSLMVTELAVALEAAGITVADPGELTNFEVVSELIGWAETRVTENKKRNAAPKKKLEPDDDINVPAPLVTMGRRVLRGGQRAIYERVLDSDVTGEAYVPPFGGYIVAANHSSHLDMGLVKHALGEQGEQLVALAAKDYFFDDPVRRMYFENFTNLVPMERHGSLRESLRMASQVVREGSILLIFPEGTRSKTGIMIDFKPSLGYLAMQNRCGILPMYLAGCHDAMPKGALLPKRGKQVSAHVGPFQTHEALVKMTEGMPRKDRYRTIAENIESIVRGLAPRDYEWTLGKPGRRTVAQYEAGAGAVHSRGADDPQSRDKGTGS